MTEKQVEYGRILGLIHGYFMAKEGCDSVPCGQRELFYWVHQSKGNNLHRTNGEWVMLLNSSITHIKQLCS